MKPLGVLLNSPRISILVYRTRDSLAISGIPVLRLDSPMTLARSSAFAGFESAFGVDIFDVLPLAGTIGKICVSVRAKLRNPRFLRPS
jgi:hypothetical protein